MKSQEYFTAILSNGNTETCTAETASSARQHFMREYCTEWDDTAGYDGLGAFMPNGVTIVDMKQTTNINQRS